jgi:hypothetical protein
MHRANRNNIRPGRTLFLATCKKQDPRTSVQKIEVASFPDSINRLFSFRATVKSEQVTLFSDHTGLSKSKRHSSGTFFTRLQAKKYAKRHVIKAARATAIQKLNIRKSVVKVLKEHTDDKQD